MKSCKKYKYKSTKSIRGVDTSISKNYNLINLTIF